EPEVMWNMRTLFMQKSKSRKPGWPQPYWRANG
ncbi:hypothetical protein A2U01_0090154, partial [Trifolium medium]|nr:hypothetical protein [Trifolium medium]